MFAQVYYRLKPIGMWRCRLQLPLASVRAGCDLRLKTPNPTVFFPPEPVARLVGCFVRL
jgi:hypothetical protein